MILDELLESQGLKEGIHYEKQVTLRDRAGKAILNEESGKRMIPDTILHYPDGKDAVIDSKVSLTAFVDYQNAETDEARADALQRHVRSVRQHVAELARKDYSAYIKLPRQALNYVIMFVPNEGRSSWRWQKHRSCGVRHSPKGCSLPVSRISRRHSASSR